MPLGALGTLVALELALTPVQYTSLYGRQSLLVHQVTTTGPHWEIDRGTASLKGDLVAGIDPDLIHLRGARSPEVRHAERVYWDFPLVVTGQSVGYQEEAHLSERFLLFEVEAYDEGYCPTLVADTTPALVKVAILVLIFG